MNRDNKYSVFCPSTKIINISGIIFQVALTETCAKTELAQPMGEPLGLWYVGDRPWGNKTSIQSA